MTLFRVSSSSIVTFALFDMGINSYWQELSSLGANMSFKNGSHFGKAPLSEEGNITLWKLFLFG